jgi:hypothetical protein
MTEVLRHGIVAKTPEVVLSGDVEFDELYVVAGHKGNPEAVRAKGREGRRNRLKGGRGRGTLEKEKPPIFGPSEQLRERYDAADFGTKTQDKIQGEQA